MRLRTSGFIQQMMKIHSKLRGDAKEAFQMSKHLVWTREETDYGGSHTIFFFNPK